MARHRFGHQIARGDLQKMSEPKVGDSSDILDRLSRVLTLRKAAASDSSYVAGLYAAGLNKILEKVGEESIETILAAKDAENSAPNSAERENLIKETADLWFHSLVMLSHLDIGTNELLQELDKRFGTSGLIEKAAR